MKTIFSLVVFVAWANWALAQANESNQTGKKLAVAKSNDSSQFYIEKGLVEKVYNQTTAMENESHSPSGSILPNIGVLNAQDFSLQNDYFAVDYAEQMGSIPFISFAINSEIARIRRVSFSLKGELGYSYKQGTFNASSSSGPDVEDTITLQWVPVIAGFSSEYSVPWVRWIKPSIDLVTGAHYLHHSGTIDGLDQSTWVPVYGGGMNVALFPSRSSEDVFGGVTVGAMYQESTNSDQKIKGWMYKLGSTFML